MKKGIILFLISINILSANSTNNERKLSIKFDGVVTNIRDYRDYYQYTIKDKNHGYIHIKLFNTINKINKRIKGHCEDKKYSEYIKCYVY
ncbi:hypothetical protein [Arcobacter porcinus]|uniref:Uncharacterized protein n=1 Tax=Arcobacter porcinus TaxID=1935204 RepID=A0A5C2HBW6_9BACT|nr:hypothetical protein [Arcobacter porcinus]OCL91373.1 hypothetical protein AAX27_01320 [Aliarcobacter thereius]QEP40309.1 hypothetical protein APORC_0694 [Arcobacter porcinus]